MNDQYVFCSSEDSKAFHPENNSHSFIVELPHSLHLSGEWECALVDARFESASPIEFPVIVICSDLCVDSCLGSEKFPVLRRLYPGETIVFPYYVRIARDRLQRFRVYIMYEKADNRSLPLKRLFCTLHLRKCLGDRS